MSAEVVDEELLAGAASGGELLARVPGGEVLLAGVTGGAELPARVPGGVVLPAGATAGASTGSRRGPASRQFPLMRV